MNMLLKITPILLFSIFGYTLSSQSLDSSSSAKKEFYKNVELYTSDAEMATLFKKSRRKKRTATILGVSSLAFIGTGAVVLIQNPSNGQSWNAGIVIGIMGLGGLGAATGVTALLYKSSANTYRNKTLSMYQKRYGSIYIPHQEEGYKVYLGTTSQGLGISLSF